MTDHKFTVDDVIKALECCTNCICNHAKTDTECPLVKMAFCKNYLMKLSLDLINCQKAEIERLNAVHADMSESLRLAAEANKDMQAEIERLKKIGDDKTSEVLRHDASIRELHKQLETARSEAIKEFAWRLKNRLTPYPEAPFCEMVGSLDIDALVEEMTEDNNESQNT